MILLRSFEMRWLGEPVRDLCAHGRVNLHIPGLDAPKLSELDCTVSAAALYLLRSLSADRTAWPAGERMFPCCGHALYDVGGQDVLVVGCPYGVDLEVHHEGAHVFLTSGRSRARVALASWRLAVFHFADSVAEFYSQSVPKNPSDADRDGYRRFRAEWLRRRALHE